MTDIVNLNRARKAKARDRKKVVAAENRARFGLGKLERTAVNRECRAIDKALDDAKLEPR